MTRFLSCLTAVLLTTVHLVSAATPSCYLASNAPSTSIVTMARDDISARSSCGKLSASGSATIWEDWPLTTYIRVNGYPNGVIGCAVVAGAIQMILNGCSVNGRTQGSVTALQYEGGNAVYGVQVVSA